MFGLESLFAIAVFGSEFIKEQRSKKNSLNSNSWNNQIALNRDIMNPDVSHKQIMKNADSGKYQSDSVIADTLNYTDIVDSKRYEEDLKLFGYELTEKFRKAGNYSYSNF